jgi:hypothetical protein
MMENQFGEPQQEQSQGEPYIDEYQQGEGGLYPEIYQGFYPAPQNVVQQLTSAMIQIMQAIPMLAFGKAAGQVFLQRNWLPPEEHERLVSTYGAWATERAESMIPPIAGIGAAEAAAKHMYEQYRRKIAAPPAPAPAPRRKAKPAAGLTTDEKVSLADDAIEFYKEGKVWPDPADIVVWAEEKFTKSIKSADGKEVLELAKRRIT